MRLAGIRSARQRAGLTLVELVVAAGLASLLFVALFSVLEDFMDLWERSEERRAQTEETSGVLELLASDLAVLAAGQRGDFVGEWVFYDTDGNGIPETKWPRLRMVRNASPAELQRLTGPSEEAAALGEGDAPVEVEGVRPQGLIEVVWLVRTTGSNVVPEGASKRDFVTEGYLWRGERLYDSERDGPQADGELSFFSPDYFGKGGAPQPGSVNEVSGGVLWLGVQFATQTSLIHPEDGGWQLGPNLADVASSWDAWASGRPDAERHAWNEPGAGMPVPRGRPALPRRVRLELELEHADDLKHRTRLVVDIDSKTSSLQVVDGERLPAPGGHVLIESEWMEVLGVDGERANVRRGARGTTAGLHGAGALVHHGRTAVREVPVGTFRGEWNL